MLRPSTTLLVVAVLSGCRDRDDSAVLGKRSEAALRTFRANCTTHVLEDETGLQCERGADPAARAGYSLTFDNEGRVKSIEIGFASQEAELDETFDRAFGGN